MSRTGVEVSVLTRNNVHMRGTGDRAMVFAHGFGCDQTTWRHIAPHFETEFATVLFDHVGSGGSELSAYKPEKYADLRGYARDLLELGRELRWEDAIFVGHSCSAMIGALASIEAPDMFERLVLIGPSPRYINNRSYVGGFSEPAIDALLVELRRDYAQWVSAYVPQFMGNPDRPALATELVQSFQQADPSIAADFARTIFTWDVRSELKRVAADTLILQCARDPVVPNENAEYVHRQISRSTLKVLAVDGHFPHLSAPEQTLEAIRQFISVKVERRARSASAVMPSLRFSADAQAARPRTAVREMSDAQNRAALEDLLLRRAGELISQLGRLDMHALTILRLFHRAVPSDDEESLTLRSRGAVILERMRERSVAASIVTEFSAVQTRSATSSCAHEIAARNSADIPRLLNSALTAVQPATASARDGYDFANATDEHLTFFADVMERDILKVAALYLRLANCDLLLQRALTSH